MEYQILTDDLILFGDKIERESDLFNYKEVATTQLAQFLYERGYVDSPYGIDRERLFEVLNYEIPEQDRFINVDERISKLFGFKYHFLILKNGYDERRCLVTDEIYNQYPYDELPKRLFNIIWKEKI